MRNHAIFCDRLFSARDTLEQGHALLHELVGFDINQIGAGQSMLGYEDGLLVPLYIREEFGRLALQGCDKFGSHEVTL